MHILIVGGSGFIGQALCSYFLTNKQEVTILTRNVAGAKLAIKVESDRLHYITDLNNHSGHYEVIINLAGQPLNKKRWNKKSKQNIYDSRIQTTKKIINYIKIANKKPETLISGSAIGFYGSHDQRIFTEDSQPADNGFTYQLCNDWERAAQEAKEYGVRVCLLRTGIVLEKNGGVLKEMLMPFKLGFGTILGDGQQWMSWIHMDDMVRAIDFLVKNKTLNGPFNFTAPHSVTNQQFSKTLASILRRPCFLNLPACMVKVIFGEMGEELLLKGQKVLPDRLSTAEYKFKYANLQDALTEILH